LLGALLGFSCTASSVLSVVAPLSGVFASSSPVNVAS
jgi:hypothetical protein